MVGTRASTRRPAASRRSGAKNDVSGREVVVLGSGNLGLVYLMESRAGSRSRRSRSATRRCRQRCARIRTSAGCSCAPHGTARVVLGPDGARYLDDGRVEGEDPLAAFSPTAARHLLRTDGFAHVADIMVGSFYDPALDEGCAFEELISFHGGLGGPQTRPFILSPPGLPLPDGPIIGAAAVHALLRTGGAGSRTAPTGSSRRHRARSGPPRTARGSGFTRFGRCRATRAP